MKWPFERMNLNVDGLGIGRILYFTIILLSTVPSHLTHWSLFDGPTCTEIIGVIFNINLTYNQALIMAWLFRISTLFSILGLFTIPAMWISFISLFLLNANALKFCYWNHHSIPLHVGMFLWALLDRNSSFRVDNIIKHKIVGSMNLQDPITLQHNEILPMLNRIYFSIIFFLSGFTKLKFSGWSWVASDSLKNILITQNFAHENYWPSRLFVIINSFVIKIPYLTEILAFTTILIEIAAPLVLFKTKLRKWILIDLALMQIGIYILMYIKFSPWAATYIFWLPLNEWGSSIRNQINRLKQKPI